MTLVKVQNAYRQLSDEGLVVSQQGRGTFVIDPSQPVAEGQGEGTAFVSLVAELHAMHETIRQLGDRLERLERIVDPDEHAHVD